MRSVLAASTLVTVWLILSPALGDPGVAPFPLAGEPGFWVPRAVWLRAELALETEEARARELAALERQVDALLDAVKLRAETASIALEAAEGARRSWRDAESARAAADADLRLCLGAAQRGWWESPVLWGAVGAGACAAVCAATRAPSGVTVCR